MGFLIEILGGPEGGSDLAKRRDLVSEEELLKTHSREMYNYLKSTLRYEIKVPVKKSDMMSADFDKFLDDINKGNNADAAAITTTKGKKGPSRKASEHQ
jgi:hypothetical protein